MTAACGHQSGHDTDDHGFTLVEILIAIVLVGILSAIVVVGISNLTDKGNAAACSASLDAAKAGTAVYLTSTGAYPTTLAQMTGSTPPALSLPSGVSLNNTAVGSNAPGTVASGGGWTLTMTPGLAGAQPSFTCATTGSSGSAATLPVMTGLIAWYDASDASSVTASGANVSAWSDKSGNANNAAVAAGTPTYVIGALNGRNVVHFDGSSDLVAPSSSSLNVAGNGLTILVTYRAAAVGAGYAFINKESSWEIGESGGGGTFTSAVAGGCWQWVAGPSSTTGSWHTNSFRYAPSWLFSVDSAAVTTGASPCSGNITPTTNGLTIGGRSSGSAPQLTGDIAEVVIFNRALTDTENDQVRAYLKAKWGTP